MLKNLRILIAATTVATLAPGCSAAQQAAVGNYLTGIVGRVDLAQVVRCAHGRLFDLSEQSYREIGSCLAGVGLNVVGNELKHAIDQAIRVANEKASGQRGFASVGVSEEAALAELHLQLGLAVEQSL